MKNLVLDKNIKSDRREVKEQPPVTPSVQSTVEDTSAPSEPVVPSAQNNFAGIAAPSEPMPRTMTYDGVFKDFIERYTGDNNRALASFAQQRTQLQATTNALIEKEQLLEEIAQLHYEKAQMSVIIAKRDAEIQMTRIVQKEKNIKLQLAATENAARRFNMAAHGYTPETVSGMDVDETNPSVWSFLYTPPSVEHAQAQ